MAAQPPPRSSPDETLAHPSDIENTFARRMVLASRFRGSMLRLPLSGMVCCEIATRTLETRLRVIQGGDGGRKRAVKKCQSLMSRPQNLAVPRRQDSPAVTYLCQKE